jgi:hypothetical protein
MTYSKAKLEGRKEGRKGEVIRHFPVSNHSKQELQKCMLTKRSTNFTMGFFKHILNSLSSFMGIPNSVRILYNIFCQTKSRLS